MASMKPRTFWIIDGHYMFHRNFHAPFANLSCRCPECGGRGKTWDIPKGYQPATFPDNCEPKCSTCNGTGQEPTKVTFLVVKQLLKLVREKKPDFIAFTTDSPVNTLKRRQLYPEYKANRGEGTDWEFSVQIKRCHQIIKALGIPIINSPGHEADDVIATLVDIGTSLDDIYTVIVSRDKDLMQLIGMNVRMYDPLTEEYVDGRHVIKKFGIDPWQVKDYLSLVGDTSDNIPGVKGIGPKGAVELLKYYGSINRMLFRLQRKVPQPIEMPKNIAKHTWKCETSMDNLLLSKALVKLNRNVPLPEDFSADQLAWTEPNLKRAKPLFRMLNFRRWE